VGLDFQRIERFADERRGLATPHFHFSGRWSKRCRTYCYLPVIGQR
jgi:hypothetical protein